MGSTEHLALVVAGILFNFGAAWRLARGVYIGWSRQSLEHLIRRCDFSSQLCLHETLGSVSGGGNAENTNKYADSFILPLVPVHCDDSGKQPQVAHTI